jgi:ABC-type antimicrobial peptide transport system permease subunit
MVLCFFAAAVYVQADDNPPANSYRVDNLAYASNGASQTIRGAYVTTSFFQAAKAQPWLGRLFLADEYQSGRGQVVVLCNRFWKQRFKADPTSIGRTLQLNGRSFTIIGVMAPTFEFPSGVDVWIPKSE